MTHPRKHHKSDDRTIFTTYYCSRLPTHQRYHMGVVFRRY